MPTRHLAFLDSLLETLEWGKSWGCAIFKGASDNPRAGEQRETCAAQSVVHPSAVLVVPGGRLETQNITPHPRSTKS